MEGTRDPRAAESAKPTALGQTSSWLEHLPPGVLLLGPDASMAAAEKQGLPPGLGRGPGARCPVLAGVCCPAILLITPQAGEAGGSVPVKPAKNSHLLFPPVLLGIQQILKNRLHEIYRHSDSYADTGGAEFTNSRWVRRSRLSRARGPRRQSGALGGQHTTQRIPFIGSF